MSKSNSVFVSEVDSRRTQPIEGESVSVYAFRRNTSAGLHPPWRDDVRSSRMYSDLSCIKGTRVGDSLSLALFYVDSFCSRAIKFIVIDKQSLRHIIEQVKTHIHPPSTYIWRHGNGVSRSSAARHCIFLSLVRLHGRVNTDVFRDSLSRELPL